MGHQAFLTAHTQVLMEFTTKTSENRWKLAEKWLGITPVVQLGTLVPPGCLVNVQGALFQHCTVWYIHPIHIISILPPTQ